MARPKDDGLKYFPFDVTFFRDPKIKVLFGKYGHRGIVVYLYLLCEIYGNYGYYLTLDEDVILCVATDLNITENLTKQIIAYLFSRSLLDGKLAESVKALSAKSIQRRYQEAKRGLKRDVVVKAKYWLLEKAETLGFIKVCPENGFSEINEDKSEKNPNKSEKNDTKESKEKENKLKESKPPAALLAPDKRKILVEEYGASNVAAYEQRFQRWKASITNCKVDAFETIAKWMSEDKPPKKKESSNGSFDAADIDRILLERQLIRIREDQGLKKNYE